MIDLPDPQVVYLKALDEAFSDYIDQEEDVELADYMVNEWQDCKPSEPIVFDAEYMDENFGHDIEEGMEIMHNVMSKDMQETIYRKERLLRAIKRGNVR